MESCSRLPWSSTTLNDHDAGVTKGFGVGDLRHVEVGGRGLVIGRNKDGYFALADTCPHQGSRLSDGTLIGTSVATSSGHIEYDREGMILRCPWHGWEFDVVSGHSLCEPDRSRVASYQVREEVGRLIVQFS